MSEENTEECRNVLEREFDVHVLDPERAELLSDLFVGLGQGEKGTHCRYLLGGIIASFAFPASGLGQFVVRFDAERFYEGATDKVPIDQVPKF